MQGAYIPRLDCWYRPWQAIVFAIVWLFTIVYFGLVASGEIVSKRTSAEVAIVFLIVLVPSFGLLAYYIGRLNYRKPVVTISSDGIDHQMLRKRIPWSSIEKVAVVLLRPSPWGKALRVQLKQGSDKELVAAIARFNVGLAWSTIDIPILGFSRTPSEVQAIVERYLRRYGEASSGPGTQAQQ